MRVYALRRNTAYDGVLRPIPLVHVPLPCQALKAVCYERLGRRQEAASLCSQVQVRAVFVGAPIAHRGGVLRCPHPAWRMLHWAS